MLSTYRSVIKKSSAMVVNTFPRSFATLVMFSKVEASAAVTMGTLTRRPTTKRDLLSRGREGSLQMVTRLSTSDCVNRMSPLAKAYSVELNLK